jgi:hypothetical protein
MTFTSRGTHAQKGFSGSMHFSSNIDADLQERMFWVISSLLEDAFGNQACYKRLVHLCNQVNAQSGEQRTIPNTPSSCIWFSILPKQEEFHVDKNMVGPIFLLTTFLKSIPGSAYFCFISENGNAYKHVVQPGTIAAGIWGALAHGNLSLDALARKERMSWTIYCDHRVFGRNYKCVARKVDEVEK